MLGFCKRGWGQKRRIGAGLVNAGNTCYLNATLQALTYTAPLTMYLSSPECEHNGAGKCSGFCALCFLGKHVREVAESGRAGGRAELLAKSGHLGRCSVRRNWYR